MPASRRFAKRLQRTGTFYLFLRQLLPELFDDSLQTELERAYDKPRGTGPLPPALLATVVLRQAYDQVGDAEAVVSAEMDRRWQPVLLCLGCEEAPFSQGVLPAFRERLIEHGLDQRLLDRTVELAKRTGKFGWQHLKAALDSSPLLGAGRVEDTFNLIGRALSTVVYCAAKALDIPRDEILNEAGITVLQGSSVKAALDVDWDDPSERRKALHMLLEQVSALEAWVAARAGQQVEEPPLKEALELLRRAEITDTSITILNAISRGDRRAVQVTWSSRLRRPQEASHEMPPQIDHSSRGLEATMNISFARRGPYGRARDRPATCL